MRRITSVPIAALTGLFLTAALGAQQTPQAGIWTERLLASVPPGLSPTTAQWDGWISVAPDLSSVAYAARFRAGELVRESMVFRDQQSAAYNFASRGVISPDGQHLAYIAVVESGAGLPAFLVVDKARVQIQYAETTLGGQWIPVFSPDSSRVAFVAERPFRRHAIGVASVAAATAEVLPVEWGPEFDAVDQPRWSSDSATLVYAAGRSRSEWVVIKNGNMIASAADITDVVVSPGGKVAFWASDGRKQFVGVDTERHPVFDKVGAPGFLPDGTLVYTASDRGKHFAMVGSSRVDLTHAAEGVAVSADRSRITPWFREDRGKKRRIVIDGVPGPEFVRVSRPTIHPESGVFAYTAEDERGFFVVTSRGRSRRYDGVLWKPVINDNGTMTAYAALDLRELRWKVEPLR
jgi:WD40 repeat protein